MVSKKKSDWPPPGWKVEIRPGKYAGDYKCYTNSKTGKRFYSKLAVLRFIKDGRIRKQGSHRTKGHAKTNPGNKQMRLLEANDSLDLPSGWTMVYRTRKSGSQKGAKYKCFIDPSTGSTFYSKPEVYRYLKSIKGNAGSSGQKGKGSTIRSSGNSSHKSNVEPNVTQISKPYKRNRLSSGKIKVLIERTSDEELPSGWIKEMRIKQRGNETISKYPCFIDPSTGRKFYSKLEVYRYLKSIKGKAGSSAQKESGRTSNSSSKLSSQKANSKPNVSQMSKPDIRKRLSSGKTEPTSSSKKEKKRNSGTKKSLFTNEVSPKKSIIELPQAGGDKESGSKLSTRSSSRVRSTSVCVVDLNTAQEMLPTEPLTEKVSAIEETKGITKQGLTKSPDADENETDATLKKMKPSTSLSRDKSQHVGLQGCSNEKAQTSKRKTKDINVPSVPFRSSKRLAGIEAEEVVFNSIPIERARVATIMKASKSKENHILDLIPNESQEETRPLDVDPQNVPASQEEKAQTLDVDTETVFPTEVEPLKKNDSLTQEYGEEVVSEKELVVGIDLSHDPMIEVSQTSVDQLLEDPVDTLPGSKIEKSPGSCENLLEIPANVERESEQPESDLCFPSPFWSDPCLEFAFKTLTGAIPLDDNVAIQDYIQHQNRTSQESNPDITVPNFCQNDEMKLVSPDVSFSNSNGFGFGSHKSSR